MRKHGIALIASAVLLNAQVVLDEIKVITATKSEKSVEGVSSSVIVVTKDEIEQNGYGSLSDIFKKIPSITLQPNAFPSANSKNKSGISIRNLGSNGVLLLIDGKRLSGEVKNPYDIDRIPASMIERIEIIKGPSSALYGSDALSGVINIITKQPKDKFKGSIGAKNAINSEGKGAQIALDADIAGKIDKLSYSLNANILRSNGYEKQKTADTRVNNPSGNKIKPSTHPNPLIQTNVKDFYNVWESQSEEATARNFNQRVEYELIDDMFLGVDFSYMKEDRQGDYIGTFHPSNYAVNGSKVPVFNVPIHSEDDNTRWGFGADYRALLGEDTKIFAKIYHSKYKKRNDVTALNWKDLGYLSRQDSANSGLSANVKITSYETYVQSYVTDNNLLTIGGEFRDETRVATVFNQAGTFEKKSVDYRALYLQDEWAINEALSIIFGVRYDDASNAKSKTTLKAGVTYLLSDFANLRASFSQGYRVPDIRERYISKQTPTGLQLGADVIRGPKTSVYDLKPEFVNAYELGVGGKYKKFNYDFALFYNDLKDKIEMVNKGSYFTFENIANAYTYGLETNLAYDFTDQINADIIYSYVKSQNKDGKKVLLLAPEHSLRAGLNYKPIEDLNIKLSARFTSKQDYEYTNSLVQNVRKTSDTAFYTDVSANYKISDFLIYAGIDNIFDEKLNEEFFVDNGRIFYGGFRYNF
jgi:outer membrane receptor for ferrienterochelin and colicins